MIDAEIFLNLPADPEEAFYVFEAHVWEVLGPPNSNGWAIEKQYIEYLQAYCTECSYELGPELDKIPFEPDDAFANAFSKLERKLSSQRKRIEIRRLARMRNPVPSEYILDPALKKQIHHYITLIRDLIASAPLSDQKRDALSNRLNAFAVEVDRDRTRLDALTSFYVFAKREANEELKPALKIAEKIYDAFTKAREWLEISGPDKREKLSAPPKQIEAPKLDGAEDNGRSS